MTRFRTHRMLSVLVLTLALQARAAEPVEGEESARRGLVFPPRKGRAAVPRGDEPGAPESGGTDEAEPTKPALATVEPVAPDPAEDPHAESAAADPPPTAEDGAPEETGEFPADHAALAPADEGGGSLWDWVDRLEGEVPTPEQVEAIEELEEIEIAEKQLFDELSGAVPPVAFYRDPRGAMAVHPLFLDQVDPSEFDIPVVVNPEVEKWVSYFTGPGRKYYERWLARSTRYRPMMYRELEKAGLPRDLVYLSMIESGYNAHAYSHAHAAGLWQFIPSTAKLYDMRVDWWIDERRDPEAALRGAIAFLSELHQMFDSWELAWAAYNGGPGRIRRAVQKAGTKDFWVIARGPYLHPETDNYVPKIMAAAIIGKHPERYGFTDVKFQSELVYEKAKVEGSVSLDVLARSAGVSVDTLKSLNPALRRFATPPEGYELRLPVGTRARFLAAMAEIPPEKRLSVARHTVRQGETLSSIASRYGVSVAAISQANGLQNVNRITVGMSLVVPVHGQPVDAVAAVQPKSRTDASPAPKAAARPSHHTVKAGDTLSGIAATYGLTVAELQRLNGIQGSTIRVGQKLALSGSAGGPATAPKPEAAATYTVRPGDTLSAIASKHGVSMADLQRWNDIRDPSHIRVGQTLTIRAGGGAWREYTVQAGDSLGLIAQRHGCTVDQLKQWNALRGSVIHPGQVLKIR